MSKHDTLDRLFREYIRERDSWACRFCGERGSDVSHYHSRSKLSVRWDADNAELLCRRCHWLLGTKWRICYTAWKTQTLGLKRFLALTERAQQIGVDRDAVRRELEEKLKGVA